MFLEEIDDKIDMRKYLKLKRIKVGKEKSLILV